MDKINKAKSISIWIFIIPFVAVNACLILITEFQWLFPDQEDIIHNTFPYIDGGAPPSIYGNVLCIMSSWSGNNHWNSVINIRQAFTATNGIINIQMLIDLALLILSI